MDRQGKIAVVIAVIVLIGWQYYYAKNYKPPVKPDATQVQTADSSGTSSVAVSTPEVTGPETKSPDATLEPTGPAKTEKVSTPSVDYLFTNHGGGILQAELLQHQAENGKYVTLNEFGDAPIGAISEEPGVGANAAYDVTGGPGSVVCERTTSQQIQITKKFTLPQTAVGKDQYVVTLDVSFKNVGDQPYRSGGYYVYTGACAPIHQTDYTQYIGFDWYHNGGPTDINVMWFNAHSIPLVGIQTSAAKTNYTMDGDNIGWAGTYSQYFTSIVTPLSGKASRVWATRIPLDLASHESGVAWFSKHPNSTAPKYAIEGALGMPGFSLKPGDSTSRQFRIYIGPRQYQLLKQLDGDESAILQFGWFGFASKILLKAMIWIKGVVGSYAIAIIVLTLTIKGALWPMQNKATQSMKKMQALTPKMNEIREKYKDDPTKMNTETMKLYKDYGVNPVAGCLPMFIQLPVFFGFYRMLGTAIELRNSKFFWVHDLSQPDTLFHISGFPVNILPLCMTASSIWMMAITPKSGDKSQQKMMMFMPLIFLYVCYNYASGLALYLMVSNLFSVAQLYLTRNQVAPVPVKLTAKKKR